MQGRDDEVRTEQRSRGALQDSRPRRALLTDLQADDDCRASLERVEFDRRAAVRRGDIPQDEDPLPVLRRACGCEQTDRELLDRVGVRAVRQRDRDVPACRSRERGHLQQVVAGCDRDGARAERGENGAHDKGSSLPPARVHHLLLS